MPWKETCVMEERMRFVLAAKKEGSVMSQLCAGAGMRHQDGVHVAEAVRERRGGRSEGPQPGAAPTWPIA